MRHILSIAVTCLSLLFSTAVHAQTSDTRVMFILDGSNSMWGQIDGTAKIDIAKDVMSDLITDWDETVDVGLMVYGHRRKNDCNDIEMVALPGPVARSTLIDKVKSISPRGKTPITTSLLRAVYEGGGTQGNYSVVLVSDGLETCEADPCNAVFALEIVNPGLDVHVVGFDVTQEESQALQCIAERTGGQFFRAGNASELQKALGETIAVATEPVAPPTPAEPVPSQRLLAKLCETCDPLPELKVNWTIRDADGAILFDGLGLLYRDDPKIAPGTYMITARYESGVLLREAELIIGEDGTQQGIVNLKGGAAVISAYATDDQNTPADPIFYAFHPILNGTASDASLTESVTSKNRVWLPAGRYKVVATHDTITEIAEIEIIAGQDTRHAFDMRVGYFSPAAALTAGGAPLGGNMDYQLFRSEANANNNQARGIGFMLGALGAQKPLRPGTYYVRAILSYNRGTVSTRRVFPVEIRANQITAPIFDMDAGVLAHTIRSETGKRIENVDYVNSETGKRVSYFNFGGTNTAALPAGNYYLRVLSDGATFESDRFALIAGAHRSLEMTLP